MCIRLIRPRSMISKRAIVEFGTDYCCLYYGQRNISSLADIMNDEYLRCMVLDPFFWLLHCIFFS